MIGIWDPHIEEWNVDPESPERNEFDAAGSYKVPSSAKNSTLLVNEAELRY